MALHTTEKTRQTPNGVHLWLLVWKAFDSLAALAYESTS
jgi:hypothetical protein